MHWFNCPKSENCFQFDIKDLSMLSEDFEVLSEQDTMLCEKIRKLKRDHTFYVQEQNWDREGILHKMKDEAAADEKIKERLEVYDRMWDGCGCKVNHLK